MDPMTGAPVVTLKDGRTAGPGSGIQTPQAQGGIGAAMGGSMGNTAMQSAGGGPNMPSTNNPASKGGANKGAPQRQPFRPQPQNPAA